MSVATKAICAVVPSIDFPCFVNGQILTARLTHIEENPINIIYHVSFSDGYTSRFMAGTYNPFGVWIDLNPQTRKHPRTGINYAQAITPDLNALCGFSLQCEVYLIVTDLLGVRYVNVWVLQENGEPSTYSIYYSNDYHFTLERTETGWQAYTNRQVNPDKINDKLVWLITTRIDATLQ